MTTTHPATPEATVPTADAATPTKANQTQTRLSVNINHTTAQALKSYADDQQISVTEAVRRLVSYGSLIAEAARDGKKILIKDGDEVERLVLADSQSLTNR